MRTPKPIKLTEADITRFWTKVDKRGPNDCWEWGGWIDRYGYGDFQLRRDSKSQHCRAHRVAFTITNGETDCQVLHRCNKPSCCNPGHLYAGSSNDNNQQAYTEKRQPTTHRNFVHFTVEEVHKIRMLHAEGIACTVLGELFNRNKATIWRLCARKTWKHV